MIAGTLEIQMAANIARLADDMAKSKAVVGGAMKDIEGAVAQAKAALGALGIGLGVGYFVSLIKGSIDAADHLVDLSKTTNLAVETLAGLKIAAEQSGSDLGSTAAAINKLSVEVGKAPEKFKALGISATDPLEQFKQLADITNQLSDVNQRNAVLATALGKSWQGAVPLLAEGSEKIGEMVARGTEAAGVTAEMARQADELNDKWVLLVGTGGLMMRVVGPLLPLFNALADEMLKTQQQSKGLAESWNPLLEVLKVLIVLGANVKFTFETIGKDIARAIENVQLIAKGDFAGSRALGELFRKDAAAAREALDAYSRTIMGIGTKGPAIPDAAGGTVGSSDAAARAAAFLGGGGVGNGRLTPDQIAKMQQQGQEDFNASVIKANAEMIKVLDEQQRAGLDQRLKAEQDMVTQNIMLQEFQQEELDRIARETALGRQALALREVDIEREKNDMIRGMQMGTWQLGVELLQALAGKSRAAAIAAIVISKGLAIAQTIQATSVAVMRAFQFYGPTPAGFAAAATMKALGAIQVGLIAATGLIQASQVGDGGASPGSAANPINTTSGGFVPSPSAPTSQIVLNLTVNGHILDTQEFTDTVLVPALKDAIDNRDVTIIGANSRQAADLTS
jgi:hypothetical protein